MLAVASWLGQVGKSNKMFFVPMVFMLAATGTSLTMTIIAKIKLIAGLVADKTAAWGDWFQMIWSVGLIVLASRAFRFLQSPRPRKLDSGFRNSLIPTIHSIKKPPIRAAFLLRVGSDEYNRTSRPYGRLARIDILI